MIRKREDIKLKDVVENHDLPELGYLPRWFRSNEIQCRNRWHSVLNPSIDRSEWTFRLGLQTKTRHQAEGCGTSSTLTRGWDVPRGSCFERNFKAHITPGTGRGQTEGKNWKTTLSVEWIRHRNSVCIFLEPRALANQR
jgi:hypothetical protein